MSLLEKKVRPFEVEMNNAAKSGVLKVKVGTLTISVTTIDGLNEIAVFSGSNTVMTKRGVEDFGEVISTLWNVERLVDGQ